jgi:hypothetical protein
MGQKHQAGKSSTRGIPHSYPFFTASLVSWSWIGLSSRALTVSKKITASAPLNQHERTQDVLFQRRAKFSSFPQSVGEPSAIQSDARNESAFLISANERNENTIRHIHHATVPATNEEHGHNRHANTPSMDLDET